MMVIDIIFVVVCIGVLFALIYTLHQIAEWFNRH